MTKNMSIAIKRVIPLLDRILVRRAVASTRTKQGIMLPEASVKKLMEGTVVAVGPGARCKENFKVIPPMIKTGDRVLLPSYGGTKVEIQEKEEYYLFRESDILAKLE